MTNYVTRRQYQRQVKRTRFYFCSTVILLAITVILGITLLNTKLVKTEVPLIIGSGELQKIDNNTFEIVEEQPIAPIKIDLPPEIGHQIDLPDISSIPELPYGLLK